MRKLVTFLLFVSIACSVSAQWYYSNYHVTNLDDLTKEQLDLALNQSLKSIQTGKTLTIVGAILTGAGTVLWSNGLSNITSSGGSTQTTLGILVMSGGSVMASVGIWNWMIGTSRKNEIEITLLKFKGSASIYGFGFKIYF